MPWQTAPALVIISGAFTVTGGLLMGIQYAAYGKVCKFFKFCMIYESGARLKVGGCKERQAGKQTGKQAGRQAHYAHKECTIKFSFHRERFYFFITNFSPQNFAVCWFSQNSFAKTLSTT